MQIIQVAKLNNMPTDEAVTSASDMVKEADARLNLVTQDTGGVGPQAWVAAPDDSADILAACHSLSVSNALKVLVEVAR